MMNSMPAMRSAFPVRASWLSARQRSRVFSSEDDDSGQRLAGVPPPDHLLKQASVIGECVE